ncbi:hypothetical protein B5G34_08810 [Flavonifractor sp. An82]|uniref:hypothetical protein n=1 Tax=Flavonifractor sp. An82 TaxID=1965660 RepID=UPI000B36673A|nr:hypothetical protein [Flavonifractor sp. An82]OUN22123.1 hypothetical protein B5G34_08810 [Flavonifractor sp. An82]
MKQKKWPVRLISGGLMTLALVGVAVAAGQQGSKNDPLVTLSYLNDQALPAILEQVDDKVADKQTELEKKLDAVVDGYVQEVESKLNGSSGSSSGGVFQIVNLKAGQTVVGTAACEFLLRSGTAVCVSDSAPGLIDTTAGSTLSGGSALTANHLYLATIDGRGVKASTDVTIMVRGSYTIQ